jgi:VCBS repeat-containing protein
VQEDSGPFNLLWATGISPGPADEVAAGQVVLFDVTLPAGDAAKFLVPPTISDSGILRFTPADDANGQVIATVVARDTSGASLPGIPLTINITPVNDIPIGVDDELMGNEDSLQSISANTLLANDSDVDLPDDVLSIDEVAGTSLLGAVVTLSSDGQTVSYDPRGAAAIQALRPGQTISDVFTYRARDLSGALTNPTNVTITLSGVNDAPVAANDLVSVAQNQPTIFSPLANDSDIDGTLNPASVLITLQPAFGSLTINNAGQFTYTPSSSFTGTDFIRYVVRDDLGAVSNQASISIVVNDPPVAADDAVLTYRNETVTFNPLTNDVDPDGTLVPSSMAIINPPLRGLAIANEDGTITYQPNPDYFGDDSFTYQVRDNGGALSNVATVSVRVIASRLQNPSNALDVNNSGQVSPIDALLIINHLNRGGSVDIAPLLPGPPFFDVDGNLRVTPTDALRVINFLNRTGGVGGEGEGLVVGPAMGGFNASLGWSSAFASSHLVAEGEGFTPVLPTRSSTSSVWEWNADEDPHHEWFDYLVAEEEDQEETIDSIWSSFGNIQ